MTTSALGYDLSPGVLLGDWVIERPLGHGTAGTVLRCHHRDDPAELRAIKVLEATSPAALERFAREAEVLQGIAHPSVVRVYGIHLDMVPPFMEMALVEGTDLEAVVLGGRGLGLQRSLEVAQTLAEVLAHLHGHAIYHRDLKPANVILGRDRSVTLVDFGIVKQEDGKGMTAPGTLMGTVAYSPPEWTDPRNVQPPLWDIYALGVLLLEMIRGTPEFPPESSNPMLEALRLMKIKAQQPHLELDDGFPEALRAVVRDLTRRDPAERLQTAREAVYRLREVRRDPEVVARIAEDRELETPILASRAPADPVPTVPAPVAPAPPAPEPAGEPGGRAAVWLGGGAALAIVTALGLVAVVVVLVLLLWFALG